MSGRCCSAGGFSAGKVFSSGGMPAGRCWERGGLTGGGGGGSGCGLRTMPRFFNFPASASREATICSAISGSRPKPPSFGGRINMAFVSPLSRMLFNRALQIARARLARSSSLKPRWWRSKIRRDISSKSTGAPLAVIDFIRADCWAISCASSSEYADVGAVGPVGARGWASDRGKGLAVVGGGGRGAGGGGMAGGCCVMTGKFGGTRGEGEGVSVGVAGLDFFKPKYSAAA